MQPAVDQVASTARMVLDNVPKDVKDNFDSYVNEGKYKYRVHGYKIIVLCIFFPNSTSHLLETRRHWLFICLNEVE